MFCIYLATFPGSARWSPSKRVFFVFKPHVELLADGDLDPAAVPRVNGPNPIGAAGGLKTKEAVGFVQDIFPNLSVVCLCRLLGKRTDRFVGTFPSAPSRLGLNKRFSESVQNWLLAQYVGWK